MIRLISVLVSLFLVQTLTFLLLQDPVENNEMTDIKS